MPIRGYSYSILSPATNLAWREVTLPPVVIFQTSSFYESSPLLASGALGATVTTFQTTEGLLIKFAIGGWLGIQ